MNVRALGQIFLFFLSWHGHMLIQYQMLKRRKMSRRRWWVRPVNRVRDPKGLYKNLVEELLKTDHEEFFGLFRMWPEQFELLVELLEPHLKKNSIRTPLPTPLRVAVTLLFLSQGSTAKLQHVEFRIGKSTVHKIIHETCRAIWKALQPTVLETPDKRKWKEISDLFMELWQFPHCIGAIDGRHMRIRAPIRSGSRWYNYKQFFSMVLLGVCDAKYKFTWVDIGQYGVIYDIITETPGYGSVTDERGTRTVAIMPHRVNGQYVIEGLTSSFMFTMGGLGFIVLNQTHSPSTPKFNRLLLIAVGFLCVIVAFFSCWIFMRIKLPGYLHS